LGKIERALLVRLALCMDPKSPATAGLVERGIRSVDPDSARDAKDRKQRLRNRAALHAELNAERTRLKLPREPGSTHWSLKDLHGIPIRSEAVGALVTKIVRGVLYREIGQYIAPPLNIRILFGKPNNPAARRADATLASVGRRVAIEPGVVVYRAPLDDPTESLLSVEIWATWKFYVAVAKHVKPGMATDNVDYVFEPLPE